jgi:hypothetical protein
MHPCCGQEDARNDKDQKNKGQIFTNRLFLHSLPGFDAAKVRKNKFRSGMIF